MTLWHAALAIWINSRRQKIPADNFKFGFIRHQFLLLPNTHKNKGKNPQNVDEFSYF